MRIMREAAQARREREALAEARRIAPLFRQAAGEKGDPDEALRLAREGAKLDPNVLPERWARWVLILRDHVGRLG